MSRLWVSRRSLQVGAAEPRRRVARVPGVEVTGEEVERENCRDRSPADRSHSEGYGSDVAHFSGFSGKAGTNLRGL